MQDSLGGNAKTLMFVNCSPSVYNESETKNSLEYARRVKEIKNNPTLNLETKSMLKAKAKIQAQHAFIEELKNLASGNGLSAQVDALVAAHAKPHKDDDDSEEDHKPEKKDEK